MPKEIKEGTNNIKNNKAIGVIAIAALVTALGVGVISYTNATHADTTPTQNLAGMRGARGGMKPGVAGTVVSVSGNTITLTGNARPRNASSTTTYTIDATNAKIEKAVASSAAGTRPTLSTITVSGIAAGDHLMVQGTVSGTSVTATNIIDGKLGRGPMAGGQPGQGFGGMGEGIRGKVTAVNGTSITVTDTNTKDNTTATYTVDTSSAKVTKMTKGAAPTTIISSDIQVGDEVMVEGNITGSVSATTIRDQASS